MTNKINDLYQGLTALSRLSFPKKCLTCGRRYDTPEEFISQTHDLNSHSGLKQEMDDDNLIFVEVFRNCACGSTLMDEFKDRRDLSRAGTRRREKFDEILTRLIRSGIAKDRARRELLNVMQGKGSRLLKIKPSPGP